MVEECKVCEGEIRVAIFKGTGWCSENCRRVLVSDGDENSLIPTKEK